MIVKPKFCSIRCTPRLPANQDRLLAGMFRGPRTDMVPPPCEAAASPASSCIAEASATPGTGPEPSRAAKASALHWAIDLQRTRPWVSTRGVALAWRHHVLVTRPGHGTLSRMVDPLKSRLANNAPLGVYMWCGFTVQLATLLRQSNCRRGDCWGDRLGV